MRPTDNHSCPECGKRLENGFVGYGSGLLWFESMLRGFERIFPIALSRGRFTLGSWTSSGLITTRPARRCPACGTVILPPL